VLYDLNIQWLGAEPIIIFSYNNPKAIIEESFTKSSIQLSQAEVTYYLQVCRKLSTVLDSCHKIALLMSNDKVVRIIYKNKSLL